MAKLKLGKKEYEVNFDYLAIRKFGKVIGVNKPSEIEKVFSKMDFEDPSFEDIDTIAHLVRSAIKHVKVPTFDEVLEALVKDPEGIAKVFEQFNDSNSIDITEEVTEDVNEGN